ncbi:MAG: DinB family protein [Fimbriimonadaceae bacterium]
MNVSGEKATVDGLISMLQEGTRLWRAELGGCSAGAVAWQPFRHGHNIGGLLLHVGEVEGYWIEEVVAGRQREATELRLLRAADTDSSRGRWASPYEDWSLARYYEVLDQVRDRTLATLSEQESAGKVFQGPDGPVALHSIVTRLISHESYHAGQMMLHKLHHGWNGIEPA